MAAGRLRMLSRWVRPVTTPSACNLKPVAPHPSTAFCRSASNRRVGTTHGAKTRPRRNYDDDDNFTMEDVEDKVNAVLEEVIKKQKIIKYNIMRRKMTPSGAPERNLTWEAIETIRYLKSENPDEWTVERLSEGFSVSTDVIRRVLRTKFSPAPHRRAVQDAKVMSRLQQPALPLCSAATDQNKQTLQAGHSLRQLLSPGNPEAASIPVSLLTAEAPTKASALVTVPVMLPKCHKDSAVPTTRPAQVTSAQTDMVEEEEEEEEMWDGQVLSEEDLDEFRDSKPAPVLRDGNDFFDDNGQFLYRI
nr:neugrin-like [Nerophis lumbriciformis]